MELTNTVLDPATTAQEERSLMAFQNLTLASRPIFPAQSSDSEMVVSAVKEPTSVQVLWAASPSDRPSSFWEMALEASSRLDKLEKKINEFGMCLKAVESSLQTTGGVEGFWIPSADSFELACLVDGFLHKQGFSPLRCGPRKAWVHSNINKLSQASGISPANLVEFIDMHPSRNEPDVWSCVGSKTIARAVTHVTDDGKRSIYKALFLSLLNHTVDDELEDGVPFDTDVGGAMGGRLLIQSNL